MKTKTFDCVDMKRKAAARVYEAVKDMSPQEEAAYWRKINVAFARRQEKRRVRSTGASRSD